MEGLCNLPLEALFFAICLTAFEGLHSVFCALRRCSALPPDNRRGDDGGKFWYRSVRSFGCFLLLPSCPVSFRERPPFATVEVKPVLRKIPCCGTHRAMERSPIANESLGCYKRREERRSRRPLSAFSLYWCINAVKIEKVFVSP